MTDLNEPGDVSTPDNSDLTQITPNDGNSQSAWEGFSEEETGYISKKGWKSPVDLLKSYQNIETEFSKKISIPKDEDTEGWSKLYGKLGRPETAEEYEIDADESIKADVQKLLFENGLSKRQGADIVKSYNALYAARQEAIDKAFQEQSQKEKEEVITEWGDDATKNTELVQRGATLLGLEPELLENIEVSIGTKNFMQAMKKLGEAISEDNPAFGSKQTSDDAPMGLEEFYKQL